MAQAKKITLTFTNKQMDDFLQKYVCKAALKDAKKDLMARQVTEKAKPSKPALKKQNSSSELTNYKKMKADEVEALAKKKARKNKEEVPTKERRLPSRRTSTTSPMEATPLTAARRTRSPPARSSRSFATRLATQRRW